MVKLDSQQDKVIDRDSSLKFILPPEQGGNWWGWLPLAIFTWICAIVSSFFPVSERLPWDAKLIMVGTFFFAGLLLLREVYLDIYRNPLVIYISDKGIGWDAHKRSYFVKWEDVSQVRRAMWKTFGTKVKFRVSPKILHIWGFFDNYEQLKKEIKRRAVNAKVTI